MSRIIIPDAVQQAVDDQPELGDLVSRVRDNGEQRLQQDAQVPYGIGGTSAYGKPPPRRFALQTQGTDDDCAMPPAISGCFGRQNQRLCDMQRVSVGVIVGGGQQYNLQVEPTNSAWFEPLAIRATVVDANNADLNHRVLVTAVTLNDSPLESTNDVNPVAPALANNVRFNGWWTDDWQDPDAYAVGVSWPVFSDLTNKMPLRIIGLAFGLAAPVFVAAVFTIYGNAYDAKPPT